MINTESTHRPDILDTRIITKVYREAIEKLPSIDGFQEDRASFSERFLPVEEEFYLSGEYRQEVLIVQESDNALVEKEFSPQVLKLAALLSSRISYVANKLFKEFGVADGPEEWSVISYGTTEIQEVGGIFTSYEIEGHSIIDISQLDETQVQRLGLKAIFVFGNIMSILQEVEEACRNFPEKEELDKRIEELGRDYESAIFHEILHGLQTAHLLSSEQGRSEIFEQQKKKRKMRTQKLTQDVWDDLYRQFDEAELRRCQVVFLQKYYPDAVDLIHYYEEAAKSWDN